MSSPYGLELVIDGRLFEVTRFVELFIDIGSRNRAGFAELRFVNPPHSGCGSLFLNYEFNFEHDEFRFKDRTDVDTITQISIETTKRFVRFHEQYFRMSDYQN